MNPSGCTKQTLSLTWLEPRSHVWKAPLEAGCPEMLRIALHCSTLQYMKYITSHYWLQYYWFAARNLNSCWPWEFLSKLSQNLWIWICIFVGPPKSRNNRDLLAERVNMSTRPPKGWACNTSEALMLGVYLTLASKWLSAAAKWYKDEACCKENSGILCSSTSAELSCGWTLFLQILWVDNCSTAILWLGHPRPTYTGEIKDIDTDFLHLLDCNVQVAVVCGGYSVVGR